MASRAISDLHPQLQPLAETFLRLCRDQDVDPLLICTWRSAAEQEQLYRRGRELPGVIVTYARPGESAHNAMLHGNPAARAFDVVPLHAGKPICDIDHPHWQVMGRIAQSLGLYWHGTLEAPLHEIPHFQLSLEK
ncbi:M15 family metallopeptidase [Chromobacterium piscinae]|uniref:M15 family metallopeptidase n=1 Tax=Chromobacterium piscinae TaxID=686831 RepID=A0ABV0HA31_9NEIS|nr:M15 family metallopeptidase [Chromobacterium piscinae]MBX9348101.1 M15 family metallopeptidase [Chromobacterium vaccinii]MCD4503713.1 M15 family metallopeptidase [Chromobacterium piscinae]MCD5329015.1 M15 family metallopeptidase [Chromobacterium piscinae]NHQ84167.1 M15 family metallopeptidase [Chromobacterium vaccinii]